MNPIAVIAGFVVLLAILIYYLQSRERKPETPRAVKDSKERNIVKVRDYDAQYKAEQAKIEEEKKTEEPEVEKPILDKVADESVIVEPDVDDIAELTGVGPKYQELLRAAGVKSIKTIADSNAGELHALLLKTNEETGITKRPPTLRNVEDWIKSAGSH
ncbi:DUF4332 domain-containing protein [Candidatus Bathyarchaeota archaeon]|nr:DUF4332 domain-containing protein [Candidatus Bathyarchaeota archaeon]TFH16042.1 MAG: DUF4332 domain-containing protein [Candidatus Bathyarchaeota archaeon]